MKLLDLYCKAGGSSQGYSDAGFEVYGVDIEPQTHYPFTFYQADALEFLRDHGHEFDAIHASPPCLRYTQAAAQWRKKGKFYPDLVDPTREMLKAIGKPYIIENVSGAPLINPIVLNGAFFGLKVRRTRYFELSFELPFFLIPKEGKSKFRMGRAPTPGDIIVPVGHFTGIDYAKKEMRIDWMNRSEITQAIPPLYTEWIGHQLFEILEAQNEKF
jgi:DNA (cytosine-5)-methyltransferase 1